MARAIAYGRTPAAAFSDPTAMALLSAEQRAEVDRSRRSPHAREAAGHEAHLPTAWLWEGVVMYLGRDAIETTLRTVEARSAPGSRLIVAYHQPAWMLLLLALIVRRLGEPIRTVLTPHQMRELLARYGFWTRWDRDLPAI